MVRSSVDRFVQLQQRCVVAWVHLYNADHRIIDHGEDRHVVGSTVHGVPRHPLSRWNCGERLHGVACTASHPQGMVPERDEEKRGRFAVPGVHVSGCMTTLHVHAAAHHIGLVPRG